MSWLLVRGKTYVCDSCDCRLNVDYEGGAQMTQIGDENIEAQIEVSERLGQGADNPEEGGYYLYDFCVCQACYDNYYAKNNASYLTSFKVLEQQCNAVAEAKEAFLEAQIEAFAESFEKMLVCLDRNTLAGIFPDIYEACFADTHILPSKRNRQLNDYFSCFQDRLEEHISQLVKNAGDGSDLAYEKNRADIIALRALRRELPDEMFIATDIREPENLNSHICYEGSMRTPAADTPEHLMYYEVDVKALTGNMVQDVKLKKSDFTEYLDLNAVTTVLKQRLLEL